MKSILRVSVAVFVLASLANPAQSQEVTSSPIPDEFAPVTLTSSTPKQNPYGRLNPLLPKDFLPSSDAQKVDTRLIVVYKSAPTRVQRTDLLSPLNLETKEKVSLSTTMTLDILEFDSKSKADSALKTLRASNLVESVNRDVIYQITAIPNDPDYSKTWGMEQMKVPTAWNTTKGSANVIVGVIDTGIDLDHPDLIDNIWINTDEIPDNGIDDDANGYVDDINGWDFVNDDNVPNDDVTSDHWASGHGTHVAGTIAGVGNNGIGVAGVAWQAKLMALKICGAWGCSLSDHVLALQYAYNNGAQIVNESFGGGYGGYDWERDAIASVAEPGTGEQKGLLVVAAGGNSNANTEISPFHPANYRLPNQISVAATESNGMLAGFSNYSATNIDVAAPGSGIWSTLPEGAFNTTGGYGYLSGTSMAAPHVAGVAVLIQASHPSWKPSDIRKALIATVQITEATARRIFSGGIVDAAAAVALTSVPSPKLLIRQLGTGTGTVQSGGLTCNSSTCRVDNIGSFTFTATPSAASTFQGWFDECVGNDATCNVTTSHVSPVLSVKFSEPADPNISVELIESSASTPAYTDSSVKSWLNLSNTKLSADGNVRAKAVWRSPYWCYYMDSDTGGITIERKVNGAWVEEAKFIAPSLDESQPAGRFANCELFGREMVLSDDGNTLAVLLGAYIQIDLANPENDYIICGAATYRKQLDGSWSAPTLLTPDNKYDCLKVGYRNADGMMYWNGARSLTMSDDGNIVYVGSAGTILKFDITDLSAVEKSSIPLPTDCVVHSSGWNQWFNLSTDFTGSRLVIPNYCPNGVDAHVLEGTTFTPIPSSYFVNAYVAKTVISEDGKLIVLSYRGWEQGALILENVGGTWVQRQDLRNIPGFEGFVNCTKFSDDVLTLLCDSQFADVGRNSQQGKFLVYTSSTPSWTGSIQQRQYWATFGSQFDWATITSATDDAVRFDTNISGYSIGTTYADNIMGSTFDVSRVPVFTHTPLIQGVPSVGAKLTATNIGVDGVSLSNVVYQWYQCTSSVTASTTSVPAGCESITGANQTEYIVSSGLLNKFILLGVSATNEKGTASKFSTSTSVVKNTAVLTSLPIINGMTAVGQTLSATPGTWTSTSTLTFTYQWQRCTSTDISTCSNISRATSANYKLTSSDLNRYMRTLVSAKNSGGTVSVATSLTTTIGSAPAITGAINISGTAKQGLVVNASNNAWSGSPTPSVSYQWMQCSSIVRTQSLSLPRGCASIPGANSLSYTIQSGDVGKYLSLRVTGANLYGLVNVWSKSTIKVTR
jgi:subtilisin family serine protease